MLQQLFEASRPFFAVELVDGRRMIVQQPRVRVASPPQRFPLEKVPGTRRVVVVGESSAMHLGEPLKTLAPDGVEVLNCGVGASSLEQVERVAREVVGYSPDVVVLLFGHNLYIRYRALSPWTYRLGRLAMRSRLVSLIVERRFPSFWYEHDDTRRFFKFNAFLHRLAETTRRRGARLVVCTVPATLWYPPGAGEQQFMDEVYLEAVYADWTGHRDAAIDALRRHALERPTAWWYFRLALWYAEENDSREALRFFQLAFDTDPSRGRASTPINTLIRWMADVPNVDVLDLHLLSQKWSQDGLSGWHAFRDQHHVYPDYGLREAAACWGLLHRRLGFPVGRTDVRLGTQDDVLLEIAVSGLSDMVDFSMPTARWALALCMAEHLTGADARKDLSSLFSDAPASRRPVLFVALADAFWRVGNRAAAFRANGVAADLAPASAEPWLQRGEFQLRGGDRARARASFTKALEMDSSRSDARFFLRKL